MKTPQAVRVKKYSKGWAVELNFGLLWKNLHAEVYNFPDKYYFDTEEEANKIMGKILKLIEYENIQNSKNRK